MILNVNIKGDFTPQEASEVIRKALARTTSVLQYTK